MEEACAMKPVFNFRVDGDMCVSSLDAGNRDGACQDNFVVGCITTIGPREPFLSGHGARRTLGRARTNLRPDRSYSQSSHLQHLWPPSCTSVGHLASPEATNLVPIHATRPLSYTAPAPTTGVLARGDFIPLTSVTTTGNSAPVGFAQYIESTWS